MDTVRRPPAIAVSRRQPLQTMPRILRTVPYGQSHKNAPLAVEQTYGLI